jgi:phenylpropionate dioxygenase-like ring-hydroxylating dioxygenase large terminal subunit
MGDLGEWAGPKGLRMSTNTTEDAAIVERVLKHVAAGTTDTGTDVWREPVENYRSPARFEAELAHVMRRTSSPFCPSAALPTAGAYVARTAAGVPLLAVRGHDGRVRAFRNACRHRGAQVAAGAGCAKSFVCPYHAWTYELDGRLRHLPHEAGFPGLDKSAHGLVPVAACEERGGLVWVRQDGSPTGAAPAAPAAPASPAAPPAGTVTNDDPLPPMLPPEATLFDTREIDLEVNWKVLLESFIEGYHIRYTHRETFFPYGYDNLNLIDFYGRSSRVIYPFRRIEKLAAVPATERRLDGKATLVYHLFPNGLVTMLSRHTNVVVLEPLSPSRTRQLTWSLAADASDQTLAEAKRDAEFVGETGLAEDRAVVQAIQQGMASGANEAYTFGRYESAIVHFHRVLDEVLALAQHAR